MSRMSRFTVIALLVATTAACASFGRPHVADVRNNPGAYHNRTIHIDGVVTSAWGLPLLPFTVYKVDDGTGEMTVLSQGLRAPTTGSHVSVKGRVDEVAMFGGRALGLHLREETMSIRRY